MDIDKSVDISVTQSCYKQTCTFTENCITLLHTMTRYIQKQYTENLNTKWGYRTKQNKFMWYTEYPFHKILIKYTQNLHEEKCVYTQTTQYVPHSRLWKESPIVPWSDNASFLSLTTESHLKLLHIKSRGKLN